MNGSRKKFLVLKALLALAVITLMYTLFSERALPAVEYTARGQPMRYADALEKVRRGFL